MSALAERLAAIGDLESLLPILEEYLGWPMGGATFDELTYPYSPQEVGLDPSLAVKVERVRRLRPFVNGQPWGIFFVDFGPGRLSVTALRKILRAMARKPDFTDRQSWAVRDLLFVSTAGELDDRGIWFGSFEGASAVTARLSLFGWRRGDTSVRTLLEYNLPRLRFPADPSDADGWRRAWSSAFDVEPVTERFFEDLKAVFGRIQALLPPDMGDTTLFVQRLLNRLLFLQFVSKKGWLRLGGRTDYLKALFEASSVAKENFYADRLYPAFFRLLGTPHDSLQPADLSGLRERCGDLPYLGGGLFDPVGPHEAPGAVQIPDTVFELLFAGLFARYNFTVAESTPLDVEVAVDPEMLGKVFERLVAEVERQASGSFYTPRPIVTFMCREALKLHLGPDTGALVDDRNAGGIEAPRARAILSLLETVAVIDPACGSGAFLVGMLHEIEAIHLLLEEHLGETGTTDPYLRRLRIVQRNLYGVDAQEFAINIARLRLWLALAVEHEGATPEPLPALDFKIEVGDSLSGPPPDDGIQPDLFRSNQLTTIDALRRKFADPYWQGDRIALKAEIASLRRELIEWAARGSTEPGFDWRVEFSEVFTRIMPGFDIVVANPPYVSALEFARSHSPEERERLRRSFTSATGAFDLFVPFFERGLQLLREDGVLAYIAPNKYLSASYAIGLRNLLARAATLVELVDTSHVQVFAEASVYPVVSFLRAGLGTEGHNRVRIRPHPPEQSNDPSAWRFVEIPSEALELLPDRIWGFLLSEHLPLLRKLIAGSVRLDSLGRVNASTTAAEAESYGQAVTEIESNGALRVVNTGTIDPYVSLWGAKPMTDGGRRLLTPWLDPTPVSPRRLELYRAPKIIFAKMARRCEGFLDSSGDYASVNTNCFYDPVAGIRLEYIAAFCHSAVFHFLYSQFFGALRMSGGYFQFQAPQLRVIPVRVAADQSPYVELVRAIKSADTSTKRRAELQREIDELLFALYGLDNREVEELRQMS